MLYQVDRTPAKRNRPPHDRGGAPSCARWWRGMAMAALALGLGHTRPLAAQHFPDEAGLLELIRARVDSGRAVGIVVGVLEADGTRRYAAYGDPGPDARPLSAESVFEIGSIAKAFTGILLAEMAARGEVRLDGRVADHVHDGVRVPSRGGREITLLDLATHRSSLPRLPANLNPEDPSNPYASYTVEDLHEFISQVELERDIGSEYEYSNLGMGFLGHVLATVAGTDYETLVRERILEPLGMSMSGISLAPEMRARLVVGHDEAGAPVPNWDIPALAGAGALRSSAEDMLAFLEANVGEPETGLERAMRTSHESRRPAGGANSVGLGWHILSVGEDRIVWHNGGTGGYRTWAGFDPDRDVAAVVLTNSTHGADDIGFHLVNEAVPLATAPAAAREEVEVAREVLGRYVGTYRLTEDFEIEVTLAGGRLYVQATGQQRFPVFAASETEFFLRAVEAGITFVVEDGRATAMTLHQGGVEQTAERVP